MIANSILMEAALKTAAKGTRVLPLWWPHSDGTCACVKGTKCDRPGKHPVWDGGYNIATTDSAQILKWWSMYPHANIGVPTGKVLGAWVLDIDSEIGFETLRSFEKVGKKLPITKCVRSGRVGGGKHLYFNFTGESPTQTRIKILPGLDVISNKFYIIYPPSLHYSGKRYTVEDESIPIADAPDWLNMAIKEARLNEKKTSSSKKSYNIGYSQGEDKEPILEGARNDSLFRFLCSKVHTVQDYEDFLKIGINYNLEKCSPPLDDNEVEKTARSAWGYHPEQEDKTTARSFNTNKDCIKWFDAYYSKAVLGGRVVVFEDAKGIAETFSKEAFFDLHANKWRFRSEDDKSKSAARIWFENTDKVYSKVVFDPNPKYKARKEELNLWKGFVVQPEANGKAKPYLDFVKEVICANSQLVYDYVCDVMAQMVKSPHDKTGCPISIAVRGEQGTGKSFFVSNFGYLFGDSYIEVNSPEYLTRNFNGFLRNKILVFGDEAIWGGNKANRDMLKGLISSSKMNIEDKFKDLEVVDNYLRFFFSTNSDWAAPVERGNRRYLILDASTAHTQDSNYFASIKESLVSGGYQDLLYFLLHRDISKRDFEKSIPKTKGLEDNLLNSLDSMEEYVSWSLDLSGSSIFKLHEGSCVDLNKIFSEYLKYSQENQVQYIFKVNRFSSKLVKILPSLISERKQKNGTRSTVFKIPALSELQKDFSNYLGFRIYDQQETD